MVLFIKFREFSNTFLLLECSGTIYALRILIKPNITLLRISYPLKAPGS